jgi:hypothetical protein
VGEIVEQMIVRPQRRPREHKDDYANVDTENHVKEEFDPAKPNGNTATTRWNGFRIRHGRAVCGIGRKQVRLVRHSRWRRANSIQPLGLLCQQYHRGPSPEADSRPVRNSDFTCSRGNRRLASRDWLVESPPYENEKPGGGWPSCAKIEVSANKRQPVQAFAALTAERRACRDAGSPSLAGLLLPAYSLHSFRESGRSNFG